MDRPKFGRPRVGHLATGQFECVRRILIRVATRLMWKAVRERFDRGEKVTLLAAGARLSFAAVLDAWRTDTAFSDFFLTELAATPFAAFFWEMPPVVADTIERPYEYVTIDSPALRRAREDGSPFASHLAGGGSGRAVTSFLNLGGRAILVAPLPTGRPGANAHIAPVARRSG
jgi:hypothetical protein